MADGVVGSEIRFGFNTGVTETFTINRAVYGTATDFSSLIDFEEDGTGDWDIVFTPAVAGYYRARWTGDTSGEVFVGNWHVITAAQADPAAALESATITVVSPISLTGDISLIAGDAASIPWTSSDWDDLTSATVTFQAYKLITDEAVFDTPKAVTKSSVGGASQTVTLSLLSTDTDDFTPGIAYRYEVNSTVGTLASGKLSARES